MTWDDTSRVPPEHHCLPGRPKARLVKSVRRHLRHYGITPNRWNEDWRLAWQWAHQVGNSYYHFHWPTTSEIGAQYLLLVPAKMQQNRDLRLPHRAAKQILPQIVSRLNLQQLPAIEYAEKRNRIQNKRAPAVEAGVDHQAVDQNHGRLTFRLSDRELATVLAALRQFQQWAAQTNCAEAMPHFAEHDPMSAEEIDGLCERLNCG